MFKRLFVIGALAVTSMFMGAARGASPVGQYIVVLKPGADRAAAVASARALGGDVFMEYRYALDGFAVRLPESAVAGIERNPQVQFVSEDGALSATSTCDPALVQCLPNGVDRIDGEQSSTRSGDGRGSVNVNVAVLDSGIYGSHPDLDVVGGVNCTGDKYGATVDPLGHGTAVSGVIGALDNGFGVVGVAPGARLYSVRVLDKNGHGKTSNILCGIDFVTSTRVDSDPSNDIAVANMSLGATGSDDGNCGRSNSDAAHLAICNSVAAGVTYVAGAGNSATDIAGFIPSAYDEVLTATAIADYDGQPGGLAAPTCINRGNDDSAATTSNFAMLLSDQAHTVAAPAVCNLTTASPGSTFAPSSDLYFVATSGTSFASPHVAGAVALCISSGRCARLTPAQIIQKIVGDATAYNTKNPGYGFVGDPLRPISGKYYGYLIRAGLY